MSKKIKKVKKCCDKKSPLFVPDPATTRIYYSKLITEMLVNKKGEKAEEQCTICYVHGYDPYCPNCGTKVGPEE